MPANDSIKQTLIVSTLLCLVCSIVVSTAAVVLKPIQQANKSLDKQANVLALVDLLDEDTNIQQRFEDSVEARVIDLKTGQFVSHIDANSYDQRKAVKDPEASVQLDVKQDKANIKRRANYATVYLVKENDKLKYLVLPVHGYGLWSTMYGFVALEQDLNTIYGLSFYEHAETPGLGTRVADQETNLTLWSTIGNALGGETEEKTDWYFLKRYRGKKVPNLVVTGDPAEADRKILRITGVTVTCNACTAAVKKALAKIADQLRE